MKREIKFRAWEKSDSGFGKMSMPSINLLISSCGLGAYWQFGYDELKPMDVVLMQYTGLKDKNGNSIFEGDKVKTPAGIGFVEWRKGCFYICWDKNDGVELHSVSSELMETVGNIYEN